jgi:hypothetical protein
MPSLLDHNSVPTPSYVRSTQGTIFTRQVSVIRQLIDLINLIFEQEIVANPNPINPYNVHL